MHKNKISAEQSRIQALKDELKVLELKQQEQTLQEEVNSKSFWTKHKNLRGAVQGIQSGVKGYATFVKEEGIPMMKSGVKMVSAGVKEYTKPSKEDKFYDKDFKRVMALH
jgi:hypothetical protein